MGILRTNRISGLETPTPVTGSVSFDGSGDYLSLSSSSDFNFGTGDFTLECWIYALNLSGVDKCIVEFRGSSGASDGWVWFINSNNVMQIYDNALYSASSGIISISQWNHLAICRKNGVLTYYLNGISSGSVNYSSSTNASSTGIRIGTRNDTTNSFTGYISNLRILKGTALYTSNFTPPVHELQPIGDTVLLCCNNSTSAAAEAAGKTITVNGNAAASTFSPGLTRDFTYGTQFSGVTKFDTQGYFVPPSGNTQNRYTLGLNEIVTSGLVLHLDAGNPFSYPSTGVGTKWTDLSGNNNHGTLNGGVSYTENNRGSLVFDGVNDYGEFGDVLDLGTNNMTINAWISLNSTFSSLGYLISKALAGAQDYRFGMYVTSEKKLGTFVQGNTVGADIVPEANEFLLTNRFYMVTSVIDRGSNISMYINANIQTLTGSSTISQWNSLNFQSNNPFRVGTYTAADNISTLAHFNGNIAQVQIYNRALTAAEIQQNYEALKGRYGLP